MAYTAASGYGVKAPTYLGKDPLAPAGTQYNARAGGYTALPPEIGTGAHASSTQPKFTTSPMGEVFQYNDKSGGWDLRGTMPGIDGGGGGSRASGGSGGAGTRDTTDIDRLIDEIRSSGGDYEPPQIPVTTSGDMHKPYDEAAQSAQYGAAKERTGLAMQAAMRGLKANMLQRGITGSGIDADKMGDIYGAGLGQLASTDRQMAEESSDRAFTAEQSNTDRTIRQNTTNADYLERQRLTKAQEWERKLEMISRLTSLKY